MNKKSKKIKIKKSLFKIEIFCKNLKVFTDTFDKFNVPGKNLFTKMADPKLLNRGICCK